MSVTAFPVLARILTERGLLATPVGSMAIACAAVDDVSAWSILAGVVLLVRGGTGALPLWATVAGAILWTLFVLFALGPALRLHAGRSYRRTGITQGLLAALLVVVIVSACVTEWLGIHALFGAFLAGVVMPRDRGLVEALRGRLEDVTVVLLLPLFFAFTGLRASLGLLSGWEGWGLCLLVIAVAVAGKFAGTSLAARAGGMSWRDASAIGVLMNTRGLVELVVLNVGLDIGVLTPRTFTMMVLMALATTGMTAPLLGRILPEERRVMPIRSRSGS
jgi:Kef-type K+ transport system membrane component KefB